MRKRAYGSPRPAHHPGPDAGPPPSRRRRVPRLMRKLLTTDEHRRRVPAHPLQLVTRPQSNPLRGFGLLTPHGAQPPTPKPARVHAAPARRVPPPVPRLPMRLLSIVHGPSSVAATTRRCAWRSRYANVDGTPWPWSRTCPRRCPPSSACERAGSPPACSSCTGSARSPDPRVTSPWRAPFAARSDDSADSSGASGIDLVQAFGDTNPHLAVAGHLEGKAVVWHLYDTVSPPVVRRATMRLVTRLADVDHGHRRGPGARVPGRRGPRCTLRDRLPPIDSSAFVPDAGRRAAARRELGLPADALVVGAVGNRNPRRVTTCWRRRSPR